MPKMYFLVGSSIKNFILFLMPCQLSIQTKIDSFLDTDMYDMGICTYKFQTFHYPCNKARATILVSSLCMNGVTLIFKFQQKFTHFCHL